MHVIAAPVFASPCSQAGSYHGHSYVTGASLVRGSVSSACASEIDESDATCHCTVYLATSGASTATSLCSV